MFNKVGSLTLYLILFLIFIGGVVRGTGAGMGCPDWPKCFGLWIPPTDISQLPVNYQEIFGAKLKGEVIFNATKTWIEYLNRLLGVLVGIFVFLTFCLSFFNKINKLKVIVLSGLVVIFTGFQGWLGSKVVSSELSENLITLHMFVALLILVFFVATLYFSRNSSVYSYNFIVNYNTKTWVLISLIIVFLQIIIGSQVRENVDVISKSLGEINRNSWIDSLGIIFKFHRSFSILVLLTGIYLFINYRSDVNKKISKTVIYILIFILIEILVGVVLNYFGFPALAQPIHLGIGILIFYYYLVVFFNCRFLINS